MQDIKKTGVLKGTFIFSSLNDAEIDELAGLSFERTFAANEFIFHEGDAPDSLYIIAQGQVKVVKYSSQGKEFIVAFFSSGEMFGEVAVFQNRHYPASVQTATETRVLGIRRRDFLSFLADHPEISLKIINVLSGRLRDAQNRLRDLAGERVEQRLARTMLMLSARIGSALPFTRQELADMSGTTTETAIRFMANLKERGVIRSTRGKIIILDEVKLKLLSEGPPQV